MSRLACVVFVLETTLWPAEGLQTRCRKGRLVALLALMEGFKPNLDFDLRLGGAREAPKVFLPAVRPGDFDVPGAFKLPACDEIRWGHGPLYVVDGSARNPGMRPETVRGISAPCQIRLNSRTSGALSGHPMPLGIQSVVSGSAGLETAGRGFDSLARNQSSKKLPPGARSTPAL